MPRHSKNNTASSVFTYHEAKSLNYGTKRQRLGRDSFREYDACFLCLQTARDQVACPEGHLACRECMYEMILTQKQKIKQEKERRERLAEAERAANLDAALKEEQKKLDEFERTQSSMLGSRETESKKRKIDELSSFWVPSKTPDSSSSNGKASDDKPIQMTPMCTATKNPHPVSLKSLIQVKFQTEEKDESKKQCPACLKGFSNSSKLSVMRNCGHVMCNPCVDMFVKKAKRCYVCEQKVKSKDIVDMSPEGTGFAGNSTSAVATKWDVAFQ